MLLRRGSVRNRGGWEEEGQVLRQWQWQQHTQGRVSTPHQLAVVHTVVVPRSTVVANVTTAVSCGGLVNLDGGGAAILQHSPHGAEALTVMAGSLSFSGLCASVRSICSEVACTSEQIELAEAQSPL